MYITLELFKLEDKTFVDKYITPYLSFYYENSERIREKTSMQISKELREFLKKQNYLQTSSCQNSKHRQMKLAKKELHFLIV